MNNNRIMILNLLLQYCSYKGGVFTTGERIVINQDRGYLLSLNSPFPDDKDKIILSESLNQKIIKVLNEIHSIGWKPYNEIEINWCLNN